ncbi:MAG: DctP family TRAP transporter solute-binding subunit [Planctomycetota bacterium]|jgi:tripartite ATP-independent transporter DctP family solute receptor
MNKRSLLLSGMILILSLLALWVLLGGGEEGSQQKEQLIRFAHVGSELDPRQESALKFKQMVESETAGAVKVEVYYGGQLGGDRDAIEGTRLGTIQMTVAGVGIFSNFEPRMGITSLPYLFDSFPQAWAFNDGTVNAQVGKLLLNHGIRVLGYWENGFRCLTNSARPVESLRDLKGMKIRTPENPVIIETIKALGANPSPLPWPEVYMALQQGAFDGQENPITIIYVHKLYEVQKYLSLTNHIYEPMPVVISETFWRSLTAEQQRIVQKAVLECQDYNRDLIRGQTKQMLQELEAKGMTISYPDLGPFRTATRNVKDLFVDRFGKELIDQAHDFAEQYPQLRSQGEREAK